MYSFCFFFFSRKNPIFSIIRELYKKNLGFSSFFFCLFFGFWFFAVVCRSEELETVCAPRTRISLEKFRFPQQ